MDLTYESPSFSVLEQRPGEGGGVKEALFLPAPSNGIAPDRFYTTTNYPTYVRLKNGWQLIKRPRMDCAVVLNEDANGCVCVEPRKLKKGEMVLVGQSPLNEGEVSWKKIIDETGGEGIYVHASGFINGLSKAESKGEPEFAFMSSSASPENRVDYEAIARLVELHSQAKEGFIIWVVGPAVVHSGGREAFQWLIEHGYADAVFSGNGFATHDIELAMFNTTLGRGVKGGHRNHLAVLNKIRALGSIGAAVEKKLINDGVLYACYQHKVPCVLAGSIRDDGPLPEVITDTVLAQDVMREYTVHATLVVMMATTLHSIATGNMIPVYSNLHGTIAPVVVIAVDSSHFAVTKLIDRGTHQAIGVVRNADDFLRNLVAALRTTNEP